MAKIYDGFDLAGFWEDSDYARKEYVEEPLSDDLVSSIETELGVRLPASYLVLMKTQNGGIPRNTCFPTKTRTSWAEDHVAITGIFGAGRNKTYSLCGEHGSTFMQEMWGYPQWGICVCDCPSAGHDMIMLDYRQCGRDGEPEVVHVDQELDYRVTFLAKNFEAFIRGLVNESVYDTSAEDLKNALNKIDSGSFSSLLTQLISNSGDPAWGTRIRSLCRKLTIEKGYFALHADELSLLVYDLLFYLYTMSNKVTDKEEFLKVYPNMIAFGDGEFTIGGYGPGFIENWITNRLKQGEIVTGPSGGLVFNDEFLQEFIGRLKKVD
ncbi:MAG: SMI1/KNR4 family protein [Thermoguttaceae bacterium]